MNIVCFGDSNTWGYDPRSFLGDRYPKQFRWPELVAEKTGCSVINMGLNGREIRADRFVPPENTDLLLIMLGMAWEERFFCKFLCPMGGIFSLLPILPGSLYR